jgi:spore germination cell wall hydrolase CwlJ-like protein
MADDTVVQLANLIYGENGGEDYDTMVMTGSTALNRLEAGREKEFGATLPEVMERGYYAVSQNSPMYQQARSGKFRDELSERKYKQAMQIAYGLTTGSIERRKGQFFFKKGEAKSLRKKLNFIEKVGKYDVYSY